MMAEGGVRAVAGSVLRFVLRGVSHYAVRSASRIDRDWAMRILMLGNSYTAANGLPDTVARLIGAQVVAHTRGGALLAEQLNPKTSMGARTVAALADGGWDVVVMQEMSKGPVTSRESFMRSADRLCDAVRAAGAVPVLFATWAYAPQSDRLAAMGMTYEQMHEALDDAYHEAARRCGALVAEAGRAFFAHPDPAKLYAFDGSHPSPEGSLVAARAISDAVAAACTGKGEGICAN